MTVDPIAAVTTTGNSVGPTPAASDANVSNSAATADGAGIQPNAANQTSKTDIFDYASDLKDKPPALDTLQPAGKAKYLSSPTALGDQVLQKMESFHQRWQMQGGMVRGAAPSSPGPAGSADGVLPGPAGQGGSPTVAGLGRSDANSVKNLSLIFDYAIETTMLSTGTAQFSKAVNTLMRGQ